MSKHKKRKAMRRAIKQTIVLLRALTEGQGFVSIEVFDAGSGGGFQVGKFHGDWLRDGEICNLESYSQKEFIDNIMAMIDQHHDGLAIESFYHKTKGVFSEGDT